LTYGYTGREIDVESGFNYYRARYYSPEIGRFISEDPIGFEGGTANLYGYVDNNPFNFIDPLGLCKNFVDRFMSNLSENNELLFGSITGQIYRFVSGLGTGFALAMSHARRGLRKPITFGRLAKLTFAAISTGAASSRRVAAMRALYLAGGASALVVAAKISAIVAMGVELGAVIDATRRAIEQGNDDSNCKCKGEL